MKAIKKLKKFTSIIIIFVFIAIIVPTSFAKEVVLFEDDFNNGIDNWKSLGYAYPSIVLQTASENNNIIGHLYAMQTGGQAVRINSVVSGDLEADNYKYTGRMKFTDTNEYVYILFRTQDENNFYGIYYNNYYKQMSLVKNGYLYTVNGTTFSSASAGVKTGIWFNYKIIVSLNHIDVYINNMEKPVISYTDVDNPVLKGGVGIGMYTGQPGVKSIYFDDIKVTYDDGSTESFLGGNAPLSDTVGTGYEEASLLLNNLGIMGSASDDKFSPETYVTRGEMADIVTKMMNKHDFLPLKENPAKDVLKNHKYAQQINEVMNCEFMSSTESFRPDDPIKYEEAVTVCARLLGYQPMAGIYGGYAGGYIAFASKYNLLDNVDATYGYVMTRGNIANLLYNTLRAPLMEPSSFGKGVTYEMNDDVTLLSRYFNVYKGNGVVSATQNAALKLTNVASDGSVIINKKEFGIGLSNVEKYFGYNIDFYYYDYEDTTYIVTAFLKNNKSLTINASDFDSFSSNVYTYTQNDKTRTVKISALETDVIYNGKSIEGTKYIPNDGYVTFIDNDSDNNYDVVDIHDYKNVIVDSVNVNDKIIKDKMDSNNNINLRVNDFDISYSMKNTDGKSLKLAKISANSVASVALSEDGMIADIIVSTQKAMGEITGYSISDNKLEINGQSYETSSDFKGFSNINVGKQVQCYLNFEGKIVYMKTVDGAEINYSYILGAAIDEGFKDTVKIKLFSGSANSIVQYNAAASVLIDCKKVSEIDQIRSSIKKGMCVINLNSNGDISEIDYPYMKTAMPNESEDSFRLIGGGSDSDIRFKGWNQFYNNFTISNSTIYMTIPKDETQEELFSMGSVSGKFTNDNLYSVAGYSNFADGYNADLVVKYISPTSLNTDPLLFQGKSIAVNKNNEQTMKITVLDMSGKEISYFVTEKYLSSEQKDNLSKLDMGDVVIFTMTSDNEISGVASLVYDCSEKILNSLGAESDLNYKWRTCMGNIYTTQGNTIVINRDFPTEGKPENLDVSVSSGAIYIVDVSENKIKNATIGEFDNFKLYRENATPVLLIQYYLQNRMLIGYKY